MEIFNIIQKLFEKIIITLEIVNETVYEGLKKGYPDAKIIQDKIHDKEISVIKCEQKFYLNLGDGEAEVLSETQREQKKGINAIFITQDKKAKKLCGSKLILVFLSPIIGDKKAKKLK